MIPPIDVQLAREADESGRRSHEINKKKQERLFDKNSRNDVTMKSDKGLQCDSADYQHRK